MANWRPDPTFYPSPRLATEAPPERLEIERLRRAANRAAAAGKVISIADLT